MISYSPLQLFKWYFVHYLWYVLLSIKLNMEGGTLGGRIRWLYSHFMVRDRAMMMLEQGVIERGYGDWFQTKGYKKEFDWPYSEVSYLCNCRYKIINDFNSHGINNFNIFNNWVTCVSNLKESRWKGKAREREMYQKSRPIRFKNLNSITYM